MSGTKRKPAIPFLSNESCVRYFEPTRDDALANATPPENAFANAFNQGFLSNRMILTTVSFLSTNSVASCLDLTSSTSSTFCCDVNSLYHVANVSPSLVSPSFTCMSLLLATAMNPHENLRLLPCFFSFPFKSAINATSLP